FSPVFYDPPAAKPIDQGAAIYLEPTPVQKFTLSRNCLDSRNRPYKQYGVLTLLESASPFLKLHVDVRDSQRLPDTDYDLVWTARMLGGYTRIVNQGCWDVPGCDVPHLKVPSSTGESFPGLIIVPGSGPDVRVTPTITIVRPLWDPLRDQPVPYG